MTDVGANLGLHCPHCGSEVSPGESFCEACGTELAADIRAAASDPVDPDRLESPVTQSRSIQLDQEPAPDPMIEDRRCAECGGGIDSDGYCENCGTKAPSPRDHYRETPAGWVAAVCDRGITHNRNEDAVAVAAEEEPGSRAVLVVCDGVSSSTDSDVASLAAARMARDVLVAHKPAGLGVPASRQAAVAQALEAAAAQANAAVIDTTAADSTNAASCTFVAAVLERGSVVVGNVGDSRAYWIPDPGAQPAPAELTRDDSVAQMRIAAGVPRAEAEAGPQAHAITKWLGRDSPDFIPRTEAQTLTGPGWLLVCSDGLWNYASQPADLQRLIADSGATEPLALAQALVDWANAQGGKDNISVALARV